MRTTIVAILVGFGCIIGTAGPSLACAVHDQQASTTTQQQTADAQNGTTTTQ